MADDSGEALLQRLAWPDGPCCPRCSSSGYDQFYRRSRRYLFLCKECGMDVSARTGTALERSKLPTVVWIKAIRTLAANIDMRECDFARAIPEMCYRSAVRIRRRLLADQRLVAAYRAMVHERVAA